MEAARSREELGLLEGHWRAANYLSVGQIHLGNNPRTQGDHMPEVKH